MDSETDAQVECPLGEASEDSKCQLFRQRQAASETGGVTLSDENGVPQSLERVYCAHCALSVCLKIPTPDSVTSEEE